MGDNSNKNSTDESIKNINKDISPQKFKILGENEVRQAKYLI